MNSGANFEPPRALRQLAAITDFDLFVSTTFNSLLESAIDSERFAGGLVHARPGDAIVTGTAGDRWRVSRTRFAEKYRPVPPTLTGHDGVYVSLPNRIMAVQMPDAFEVLLADGVSQLSGQPRDWLVDYGDGSLGIVADAIFATTYEIVA